MSTAGRAQDRTGSGSTPKPALDGLRVIELGSTVAGPFCARLLADFGAEVIKVEQATGDALRSMGQRKDGRSLYAASLFRNKKNVSIDLRRQEGQQLTRRLIDQSDIVIENFRPGTLERWNLGYDVLSETNPGLVLVRISGFGQDGPYSQRPGYGIISESISGLRHLTGEPGRPPVRVAVSMTDYITGLYSALGAVMAIRVRDVTGKGQVVDSALNECAFSLMEPHIPAFQQLGQVAQPAGSRLPNNAPNTLFETRDGRFLHIAAGAQSVFRRLCNAIGQPGLSSDDTFSTPSARTQNQEVLEQIISDWTAGHDLAAAEAILQNADVPAAGIYDIADIFNDPHYAARQTIERPVDPELGEVAMATPVPRLSETPGQIGWTGRAVGADTTDVLEALLGLKSADINALATRGIVHTSAKPSSEHKHLHPAASKTSG